MEQLQNESSAADGQSHLTGVLASKIARAVFECGDESPERGGKAQRLQFMGGTYPNNEIVMGGLSEYALASVIERALAANLPHEGPGKAQL